MNADILVDLTPLDTFSRYSGTGRYVRDLSQALSALTPAERHGLSIGGLVSLDGEHAVGALDWSGSADIRWPLAREVAWLMARRTRLPFTLRRARPRLFHATYSLGTPRGSGVPRVVTCLDLVPLVFPDEYLPGRGVYRRALRAVEALRYHTARRVQAISRNTADELIRLLHIPASRIDIATSFACTARTAQAGNAIPSRASSLRHGRATASCVRPDLPGTRPDSSHRKGCPAARSGWHGSGRLEFVQMLRK